MAKDNETAKPAGDRPSTLEVATGVLVRMEGHGRNNARRFLGRCTKEEIDKIAACDAPLNATREAGDKFRATLGEVVDAVVKRQEAEDAKKNAAV